MFIFSTVQNNHITENIFSGKYTVTPILFTSLFIITILLLVLAIFLLVRQIRKNKTLLYEINSGKEHAEELQQLLDCVADLGKINYLSGFFYNDQNSCQTDHNPVYKFAEMRSKMVAEEKKEEFMELYRKFFSGESKDLSIKYSLPVNGQLKEFYDYAKLINQANSPEKKFILATMDISELAKQNSKLANADTILNAIFDNLPGHIIIKNMSSDFSYIRCNNSFSSLLQLSPAEVAGKTDFDLFDHELAQRIRICDMQLAANRTTADNHWFFTTPDGKDHAVRFISRLLKRPDGSELIIGFGVDITRQERIAGKLRKRSKELRLLLEETNYKAMLLNRDLSLASATPAMQELFPEQPLAAPTQHCCQTLCSCNISDTTLCPAATAAATGQPQICRYARLNDQVLQIKPLQNDNNSTTYLVAALKDNTEEKNPEENNND